MTTFFEHQRLSFKKNYLKNLIALAAVDNLDPEEEVLIYKIGIKRGLKEWQIKELLADKSAHEIFIPESVHNRMNLLYDLTQIIYADGIVTQREIEFINSIVIAFKLPLFIVQQLLELFKNGTPSSFEWTEFTEFVVSTSTLQETVL